MVNIDLDKARTLWGEELLLERESAIQLKDSKIAHLEYEVRDLKKLAKDLTQQNALFKEKYPMTAYASEIIELKKIIDLQNQRQEGWDDLQKFRIETNRELARRLENSEYYIEELYRLNPNIELPNGKRYEPDSDA